MKAQRDDRELVEAMLIDLVDEFHGVDTAKAAEMITKAGHMLSYLANKKLGPDLAIPALVLALADQYGLTIYFYRTTGCYADAVHAMLVDLLNDV